MKGLLARWLGRQTLADDALAAGVAALERGDLAEARRLARTLRGAGQAGPAYFLGGLLAARAGDSARRVAQLRAALATAPDEPAYAVELAKALAEGGEFREAAALLAPVLATEHPASRDAMLLFQLAGWRFAAGDAGGARSSLEKALALRPDFGEAAGNLAEMLYRDGEVARSREVLLRSAVGRSTPALIRRAFTLPVAYWSAAEVQAVRAGFRADLETLEQDAPMLERPEVEVGRTPFYLAYHGCDDRGDLERVAGVVRRGYTRAGRAAPPRGRGADRLRVGLVSAYFYSHSVGRAFIALVEGLPRQRFEVLLFAAPGPVPGPGDAIAAAFRRAADVFEPLPAAVETAAAVIARAELDVLVFPDLGMDPFTWFLAYWRMAPVQCACAGHPSTTGIDTIDAYLSDPAAEPQEAQAHYSERLVLADGFFLPVADRPPARGRARAPGRRYACTQTVMKLHPDFDFALRDILAADPAGEVVLYADRVAAVNRIVMERLGRTLGGAATRVRLLPRLDYEAYLESVHDAAVILDTPHFGGGNTTIEALSLNVPVVTLPGPFLRSRYAFARLRALGLDECIATDRDDYVARAVMIATNPALREDLVERLRERCAVHLDPTLPAAAFARALATCAGRPC